MNNKDSYNIKKIEHLNNIDNKYNNEKLQNLIIQTKKIEKTNTNIKDIATKRDKENKDNIKIFEKNRTNMPYKCIIKKFDYTKEIKNEKELIVYTANKEDKNKELFEGNLKKHNDKITQINDDIKKDYSIDNRNKHDEKFIQNHVYKYRTKIKDADDESDLRVDRIEFYKKEQKKLEENETKINNILFDLINTGAISENLDSIDYNKIDSDKLEEMMRANFGDEEFEKMYKELTK